MTLPGPLAAFYVAAAGVLGLIFGSFATAVAYRLPRQESIASGRSKCPNCGNTITAIQNVPVFSYVVLRGRCKHCGNRISIRYPLIELVTGALFVGAALKFQLSAEAIIYAGFFWTLVVLTVIDLEYKLLPNKIVFPTAIAGWIALAIAALAGGDPRRLIDAAVGAVIFGGFFLLVAFLYPAGMGGGDVKLAFVLGTFLGYAGGPGVVVVGMFLSFFIGGIVGVGVMARSGGGRKMQVPFGPFLALGTVLGVFAGRDLLEAYLGTF
ncbi:MAG: prepilin peptidase [Actinomycetota bacterium]|nr:prepilin peptidase [Actinomycetota bacterium]